MVRRTDPKDDEWKTVRDAKKRKQIQDRLAQRARRQRLRQAQLDTGASKARPPQTQRSTSSTDISSSETPLEHNPGAIALLDTSSLLPPSRGSFHRSSLQDLEAGSSILNFDLSHIPHSKSYTIPSPLTQSIMSFTVFSALYANGEIQGISCTMNDVSRTPMPKPHIPLPLHPTELQQMIVHPRWIDRLPFPRMRDSLIRLGGVVDEEELCKDFFTMPSFTIEVGYASWDPRAWRMEKEWEGKWGWLMI